MTLSAERLARLHEAHGDHDPYVAGWCDACDLLRDRDALAAQFRDLSEVNKALLERNTALAARSHWLQEVVDALKDWNTYFDLRGALCDACKPEQPDAMIAAQDKAADALDNLAYFDEVNALAPSPSGGGAT